MNNGYEQLDSPDKGEGIFAIKQFHRGDIVMIGVIEKDNIENHSHASQMGKFRYALHGGKITKVNHSCNPNCGINLNITGAHDFVAMQTIEIGDEITFDYAMRNYTTEYFPYECRCGAGNCRGSITGWKSLPDSFKSKYKGFVAPYLIEIDLRLNELAHH
ncbi:SET domain-containing protein-lysine N-methyltransferase [Haliea sp. E1-2-M8]|uniref:SET domain-containing protein-lysine N-methyltransferase n=1 Tax=Haliea sp. E1-2-M8 TaxID=3064706 RepID=UPI0027226D24|nr:SET domain-containing protein-lysine N-methyltransferase [Haliea sp. E1-2-M8]MDO8864267.1 SET domain-containing protein-lysine N-methyltransferase [Haliea sp. E1-2-M8]